MRMICPHCQQAVTVPDASAGQPTPCPNCSQMLTPPALTGAAVDAAPPPVPRPAPTPAPRVPIETSSAARAAAPVRSSSSDSPWLRITLPRELVYWTAPIALLIAFILSFFTWVAIAPNGTKVYSQNAWQAIGGSFTADATGEGVMNFETDLKAQEYWNLWLLFYIVLLIPTTILAIADRVLSHKSNSVPDLLSGVWPHRHLALIALCVILLLLLIAPLISGFGLQKMGVAAVDKQMEKLKEAKDKSKEGAKGDLSTKDKAEISLMRDTRIAALGLTRTGWFCLALLLHLLAIVGAGSSIWLDRHPDSPDIRFEAYC